jgi:hypothetical protein
MTHKPTSDELDLFDQISKLSQSLQEVSLGAEGGLYDPKTISLTLYQRLFSNHRGFALLWNKGLQVEADIILRSGLEVAICLAANFRAPQVFGRLLESDAAWTLQSQIKIHHADNDTEMVKDSEALLRQIQIRLGSDTKAAKLEWQSLARHGDVPLLYHFHKTLSGISAHVTGFSVLRHVNHEGVEAKQEELAGLTRKMHLMMMATATLQGSTFHAGIIEHHALLDTCLRLSDRMNAVSPEWPGVAD